MEDPAFCPPHGGQLRQIAERFGIRQRDLLDFSANINPAGPPDAVCQTLRASLDNLSCLTEYPDLEQLDLKRSIAAYSGAAVENLSVANGFVPLLEAALRATRTRRCLLPVPGFTEYRKTLTRAGVQISLHALDAESNFRYEVAALAEGGHDAILLANPQNPSGVCHEPGVMAHLIAACAKKNMHVFLDEAFIDYVPERSMAQAVDAYRHLIVFRSVTKFHGVPGLRVAYALSNAGIARALTENLSPWPISTLASAAVAAGLRDTAYAAGSIEDNRLGRALLQRDLESLGLRVYPSDANFLLFRVPAGIEPNAFWRRLILEHHIVLRDCGNYEGLGVGHFRAAVRTMDENRTLVRGVAEVMARC
jgi:threonine-phosphate decarboxylase